MHVHAYSRMAGCLASERIPIAPTNSVTPMPRMIASTPADGVCATSSQTMA